MINDAYKPELASCIKIELFFQKLIVDKGFIMFFIAGVQPRKISLDDHARMCGSCGLFQARLYRVDHYISIFFLPILRIKKGTPFITCERCGVISSEKGENLTETIKTNTVNYCSNCGRSLDTGFRFCPFCGKPV